MRSPLKALEKISVLLVGAPSGELDTLAVWLASEGAVLQRSTWSTVLSDVPRLSPAVLVTDLRQTTDESDALLALLQTESRSPKRPIIALVSKGTVSSPFGSEPKFNKTIVMPAHPYDVVNAIASLAELRPGPAAEPREETLDQLLRQRAERSDMRGLLALLNATGPFRFTSILRFDEDDQLTSVWTFDRQHGGVDSFPLDATVPSSYCAMVRASGAAFELPDAALDPQVAGHPKRYSVLSYCGVPLHDANDALYGSLCHYDLSPRFFGAKTRATLEAAASILKQHAPSLTRAGTEG
jgi:hypothetical protein